VFFEIGLVIADEPAAEINGAQAGVIKFDGILQWRIGMSKDLIDDSIVGRQIIAFTRRNGGGEAHNVGGAVRKMALRDTCLLTAERNSSNEQTGGGIKPDGVAGFAQ